MTSKVHPRPIRVRWAWLLAIALLAGGILLVYWRLLLTNRVMATGDAFTYFTPYRDYANFALRAGHLPLWNPYLFLGVPFLANPQSAVLYPLHWPFVGLDAARSLVAVDGAAPLVGGPGHVALCPPRGRPVLACRRDRRIGIQPQRLPGRACAGRSTNLALLPGSPGCSG